MISFDYGGTGTQKIEEEISTLFPDAKILRMDLDTISQRGAHDRILSEFGNGDADMLVGTQLVAEGTRLPASNSRRGYLGGFQLADA